ncbi:hypothetical protein [Methylomonas albis]|uniref:Uncharacterized protein n=1 Tax=Methylomonas albis TaxID=1854563 RepID=A0ABR9D0F1_9GAMM|nr:hypothetical protein [Methylomonas albis]MBD9356291.1 hypothetical protein [Methylomonas albis]
MDILRNIAEENNYKQDDRAGALALYWLLFSETEAPTIGASETTLDLNREKELYETLANELNEEWLAHALIGGVLIRRSETDPGALCFVTYLMNRCVDGGGARDAIIELIENWRERSTAPVNSKRVLESWLGYDFNIPTYAI